MLLRPPRLRQAGASSRPNTFAVAGSAAKTERRRLPPRRMRGVRHPQIPIARAQSKQRPFLPAVSLYGLCQGGFSRGDSQCIFSFVSFFV